MATLEVHDGQGRVQFVELEREQPILFGTSPHCEVILEGSGIKPVHGRIRWKSGRFKVEAAPDAEFVVINGHKMSNGSIDVGDEISVGPCRLFLLRMNEGEGSSGRPARRAAEDEGRTMVAPPPIPGARDGAEGGRRAGALSKTGRRSRYVRPGDMGPEQADWARELSARKPAAIVDEDAEEPEEAHGLKARFTRALGKWLPRDTAPGEERIISSPLVVSLILLLALLVGMGFWLKAIIAATLAERTFNRGMANFEDGDYRTAIRDFEAFIEANPKEERVPKARVMRALANVRQYVSPNGATWTSALEAARSMHEEFGHGRITPPEAFGDERAELGELVLRIGEGLADRARGTADPKALAEAESTVPLHAEVAGEPARALLTRSRLPSKLADARAAVRKAQVRTAALAAMDRALGEGSASRVYQARDDLVGQYADLAQDRELIAKMTAANELIRKAVKIDATRKAAARGPRPEPLGPPTTVVLRSRPEPAAASPAPESIAFALADGLGYGLDAAAGAPLWQVPLGLASPFVPRPVPGETAAIAFDARSDELVRLDARTGAVTWRLELGERVTDPPLVLGNQLVQVLPSGKVMMVALESGELRATVNLGRPLGRTPVSDESGRHLYVLGRQDNLFILNRDPLGCVAVEYLGHGDGSIPCAPALLGRYLIVPENDTLTDSRWHILVLDEDGSKSRQVQEVKVAGWNWQTPAGSGQTVWATGDRAGFEAFAVGEYTNKTPFRSVAKLSPDAHATGPAFALARSEREMWAAAGHSGKFLLDPEHGSIQVTPLGVPGPAKAPIQAAGNVIVATFQDRDLGGTALLGLDPESGVVAWKTVVGSAWPTELVVSADGGGLSTLGRDGREVTITSQQVARGGFVELPVPRPGAFALPSGLRLRFEPSPGGPDPARAGPKPSQVVAPRPYSKSLWVQDPSRPGGWREVSLPASLAADPVAWQGGVLVPGADGRVYLIDPATGRSLAEPFVPQFDRDNQGTWLAPSVLDPETVILADDVGRVRRLVVKPTPVPRLAVEAEKTLDGRIVTSPATTGAAALVATADGRVRSLAARDLSPVGAWPLDASIAGPPVALSDGGLAMDRAGNVIAFGRDGQKSWAIKLGAEVVGAPRVVGPSLVILTSDGVLHLRARGDGAPVDRRPLDVLPAGGPIATGTNAVIPVAPGTVRPMALGPS
jgi:outer membrane protein assembly factor BamB